MKKLKKSLNKYKKLIVVLAILVFILILLVSSRRGEEDLNLTTETATVRDVEEVVFADGNLKGKVEREIYIPSQAKISDIKNGLDVGDRVKKNNFLLKYKTTDMLGENTFTKIKSPIKGVVTEINYNEKDTIYNVTMPVMKIVNTDEYRIQIFVNENDISNIKKGQEAKLVFPAISLEEIYKGTVLSISPDSVEGSLAVDYEVIIKPEKLPAGVKLGMSTDVEVTTAKVESVLSIPESYLIEKDDKYFVKVLNWKDEERGEYEVSEYEVLIGLRTDEYVEIQSGLEEGDEVVEPNFQAKRNFNFFGGN